MLELPSRISCDIPFDVPGKHWGTLKVPHSRDASAWGALLVPIMVVRGGQGPGVLITAGQHGDEYEGPIILSGLCRSLDPEHVLGTVILLPSLNVSGLAASSRLATVDGRDPNRSFPGKRTGSPTQMLAHWIDKALLDSVDFVLDLHSGGRSLVFSPSIMMHPVRDEQVRQRTRAALEAFGAPTGLVIEEPDIVGSLDHQVEQRGTPFLFAELGGGGRVSPHAIGVGTRGVRNFLQHLGVLSPDHPNLSPMSDPTTCILDASDEKSFVVSPGSGVLEPVVELGDEVRSGQLVARLHRIELPSAEPLPLTARCDGTVCALRALAHTEAGDTVLLVARRENQ